MNRSKFKLFALIAVVMLGIGIFYKVVTNLQGNPDKNKRQKQERAVPVEAAMVQRGEIELQRTFSGTLEAPAKFIVAPKVSGRIEHLYVDLADTVARGQVVAKLDSAEYVQEVARVQADLAVARANLAEAKSSLKITAREIQRTKTLLKQNVSSEAQLDKAMSVDLEKMAKVEVAEAQLIRGESSLETANIRLGYTEVRADWTDGSEKRVIAERYVDEGDTVTANAPLLLIVELDPITGVIYVTEKDYGHLMPGQSVYLKTDAYPEEKFKGEIVRIAPIFRQSTRQARVELKIENPQHRLKPGMFIRTTVTLDKLEDATIMPELALTTRNDRPGVFMISDDAKSVMWREVKVGIRDGNRVQVEGEGLSGRVVTLGQHLLDDGSGITIPFDENNTVPKEKKEK